MIVRAVCDERCKRVLDEGVWLWNKMSDFESELHFAQAPWDDHDADYEVEDDM